MEDCLFCKIANKEMATELAYEDDDIVAFHDINPVAPTHILIIPKKHIATSNDLSADDCMLAGKLILTARKIAADLGFAEKGYRLTMNCNSCGGQEVFHIHLHLLAGRQMSWPPG